MGVVGADVGVGGSACAVRLCEAFGAWHASGSVVGAGSAGVSAGSSSSGGSSGSGDVDGSGGSAGGSAESSGSSGGSAGGRVSRPAAPNSRKGFGL